MALGAEGCSRRVPRSGAPALRPTDARQSPHLRVLTLMKLSAKWQCQKYLLPCCSLKKKKCLKSHLGGGAKASLASRERFASLCSLHGRACGEEKSGCVLDGREKTPRPAFCEWSVECPCSRLELERAPFGEGASV